MVSRCLTIHAVASRAERDAFLPRDSWGWQDYGGSYHRRLLIEDDEEQLHQGHFCVLQLQGSS